MKYFTYELLTSINNGSLEDSKLEELENTWGKNRDLYWEQFSLLSDRLPKDVYSRFNTQGFHDYLIEKVEIKHTNLLNTSIDLFVSNSEKQWKITFDNIISFNFDHLNKDNPAPIFSPEQDLWVYEELIPVNNKIISFEVLCQSGANLKVEFKDSEISIQELSKF